MECPRCHCKNINRFYKINGEYYCRNCIQFSRVLVNQQLYQNYHPFIYKTNTCSYHLDFELSQKQQMISHQLKENYIQQKNSIVLAVCGSGKTEIVFEMISYAINLGHRVCYTVPRKELCIELYERFHKHFNNVDIALVYGGHVEKLESQFIICTTHQLYRFEKTGFQLIILDEADAFPFYNNPVLESIFENCVKGQYVKLSATIEERDKKDEELLIINRRYHGHDLPVPYIRLLPTIFLDIFLYLFLCINKKVLVYVPTIEQGQSLLKKLSLFKLKLDFVNSKNPFNQKIIEEFKDGKIDALITTTLLERGITIENVQVIVYKANHQVFNGRTLIQIAGRVGRKPNAFNGKVCFLANNYSKEMKKCIHTIKKLNQMNV